jgi:hypothetical protein
MFEPGNSLVVESLPSMCKALGSISSTRRKQTQKSPEYWLVSVFTFGQKLAKLWPEGNIIRVE